MIWIEFYFKIFDILKMSELKLCKEKLLITISEIIFFGPQKKLTRTYLVILDEIL